MASYTNEAESTAEASERKQTPAQSTAVLALLEFSYALGECRNMIAERRRWWSRLLWWRVVNEQRQIVACLELMKEATEELRKMVETEWPQ